MIPPAIQFLGTVFFVTALVYMVIQFFRYTLFMPYRNRFARWCMFRFNPYYKRSRELFDGLLLLHEQCQSNATSRAAGYHTFLGNLQQDNRFRSSSEQYAITIEDLIAGKLPQLPIENFVSFYGKRKSYHKVVVWFNFEDNIHLTKIQLMYHEEDGPHSFFYPIAEKKFPRDDDDESYTTNKPLPVLAHC